MTLIEEFRIELKNILKEVVKEHCTEGCFKSLMNQHRVISFPNKIGSSYARALRILRTVSENSRKYLSEERLERMFDEFVAELKYQDEKEVMVYRTYAHLQLLMHSCYRYRLMLSNVS